MRLVTALARTKLARLTLTIVGLAILANVLLDAVGLDIPSGALTVIVDAGPFMAVAVVAFIAFAWRQNTGLTYVPPVDASEVAEPGQPGQVGLVDQLGQPELAKPTRSTPVTVTVLPTPVAALPQAAGQTAPIHYPAPVDEEETR